MVKIKNANIGRGVNIEEGGSSRGRGKGKRVLSRIGGRNIAFDDRLLNTILDTPQDGMGFYTKNKNCFDQNLYSERRSRGEILKRHDHRTVNKLDTYRRLLHHMISNIIIPNVGHKSSITNMHSFVMFALHEHRRINFGFMAIEYMLATQSSSTKCLLYGCIITKIFQHFMINLVGFGDQIDPSNIYNQNTFKRMGFARNDVGLLIRGGQQGSDDDDEEDNSDEEEGNEPESMDNEEEDIRREMRSKKRQERTEEGQFSVDTAQILDRISAMQAQLNDRLDDLNDKIVDIQNGKQKILVTKQNEGEKIKPLKTLNTCVLVRDVLSGFGKSLGVDSRCSAFSVMSLPLDSPSRFISYVLKDPKRSFKGSFVTSFVSSTAATLGQNRVGMDLSAFHTSFSSKNTSPNWWALFAMSLSLPLNSLMEASIRPQEHPMGFHLRTPLNIKRLASNFNCVTLFIDVEVFLVLHIKWELLR
ncbi:hypothetical protein M9H77_16877 [Catharanthus roseus]|uniref:Uncharacterized protein n=1 Tax=Catharanthus roseus TaxID=4058 RepID=A0ACC0B2Z9_CATRO|nr:hypothetical protein M9H77_16877 [Catharanthus roseus]